MSGKSHETPSSKALAERMIDKASAHSTPTSTEEPSRPVDRKALKVTEEQIEQA
jgi:hypothetical protein